MTTIKLDRRALAQVIDQDPEFRLELQRNILAEAIRKMVPKDVAKLAEVLTPEVFAHMLSEARMSDEFERKLQRALEGRIVREGIWRGKARLSDKQAQSVKLAVDMIATDALEKAAEQRGEAIKAAIERSEADMIASIDLRVKQAFDNAFEERVQVEVQRRLQAAAGVPETKGE